VFILFRFVRDEPGLIRDNNITGAIIDMPAVLAYFGYCFGKVAFIHCIIRSQFCRRRLWLRIIRRCGFRRVWIFIYNRRAWARISFIAVTALFLSLLLPVMTVRFRIRGRFLFFRARILPVWARILPGLIVAWLGFMLHGKVFGYHLKNPGKRLHEMWFVDK
jgi:hypothetical protein